MYHFPWGGLDVSRMEHSGTEFLFCCTYLSKALVILCVGSRLVDFLDR